MDAAVSTEGEPGKTITSPEFNNPQEITDWLKSNSDLMRDSLKGTVVKVGGPVSYPGLLKFTEITRQSKTGEALRVVVDLSKYYRGNSNGNLESRS